VTTNLQGHLKICRTAHFGQSISLLAMETPTNPALPIGSLQQEQV